MAAWNREPPKGGSGGTLVGDTGGDGPGNKAWKRVGPFAVSCHASDGELQVFSESSEDAGLDFPAESGGSVVDVITQVTLIAKCLVADAGYEVGDEVLIPLNLGFAQLNQGRNSDGFHVKIVPSEQKVYVVFTGVGGMGEPLERAVLDGDFDDGSGTRKNMNLCDGSTQQWEYYIYIEGMFT